MSQASSTSVSGGINFSDPEAGKPMLWLIVAAAIVLVIWLFKRK